MSLSIVIPAYNESSRLGDSLREILRWLDSEGIDAEILVVDDGSSDDTAQVAGAVGDPRVEVVSYSPNRGKGYAVRTGMLRASGDPILFSDADLSTPIHELKRLQKTLDEGYDIVIGSRAVTGSKVVVSQSGFRKYGGKLFNLVVRAILPLPFKDTQCGFKLFRRHAARAIFGPARLEGFSFDVETLFLGRHMGLRIAEIPIEWHNAPGSKVNFLRDALRMLRDVIIIRWWSLRRAYRLDAQEKAR
jgi:glycosyltransferase involved in cell wall biosynthesis